MCPAHFAISRQRSDAISRLFIACVSFFINSGSTIRCDSSGSKRKLEPPHQKPWKMRLIGLRWVTVEALPVTYRNTRASAVLQRFSRSYPDHVMSPYGARALVGDSSSPTVANPGGKLPARSRDSPGCAWGGTSGVGSYSVSHLCSFSDSNPLW